MTTVAFWVGYFTPPVAIAVIAFFTFRFMRGLYRKVTR